MAPMSLHEFKRSMMCCDHPNRNRLCLNVPFWDQHSINFVFGRTSSNRTCGGRSEFFINAGFWVSLLLKMTKILGSCRYLLFRSILFSALSPLGHSLSFPKFANPNLFCLLCGGCAFKYKNLNRPNGLFVDTKVLLKTFRDVKNSSWHFGRSKAGNDWLFNGRRLESTRSSSNKAAKAAAKAAKAAAKAAKAAAKTVATTGSSSNTSNAINNSEPQKRQQKQHEQQEKQHTTRKASIKQQQQMANTAQKNNKSKHFGAKGGFFQRTATQKAVAEKQYKHFGRSKAVRVCFFTQQQQQGGPNAGSPEN